MGGGGGEVGGGGGEMDGGGDICDFEEKQILVSIEINLYCHNSFLIWNCVIVGYPLHAN